MARHRRQQASARRSTLHKPGRRLSFEGLESRNLLSAIGWSGAAAQPWPVHEPWAGLRNVSMPPAIFGGLQPLRPEGNNLVPASYEVPRVVDSVSIDIGATGVSVTVGSNPAAAESLPPREADAARDTPDAVANALYGGLEQVSTAPFAAGAASIAADSLQASHTISQTLFVFDAPPLGPMIVDIVRAPRFVFDAVSIVRLPLDPRPSTVFTDAPNRPAATAAASSSQPTTVDLSPMGDDAGENSTPVAGRKSDPPALYDEGAGASSVATDSNLATPTTVGAQTQVLPHEKTAEFAGQSSVEGGFVEGGFVAIEDASATSLRTGTSAAVSSAGGTPDTGNRDLWSDLSPGAGKQARQAADSDSARSGKPVAADVSDNARGQARPQTAADSADGGLIELADGAPVTAVAAEGESGAAAGDSAQVAGEIRPESGVALYCDMQVAIGGPFGDRAIGDKAASAAAPAGGDRSATRAENSREAQAKKPAPEVSPRIDTRQRVSSWWTGRMPLWASVALAALLDGIWRTRAEPDRQRGIRPFGRFWRRERN